MKMMLYMLFWMAFSYPVITTHDLDGIYSWGRIFTKCAEYAMWNDFITSDVLFVPTSGGLDIPYVKISDSAGLPDEDRKAIFVVGGTDTSPIGPSMVFYIIDRLVQDYVDDVFDIVTLLKTNKIFAIPMLNADSYEHLSDLWDDTDDKSTLISLKNRNFNEWCENNVGQGQGVNLNHNWGEKWGYDDIGSSDDPCNLDYRGPSAWSEHEVSGLKHLAEQNDVNMYISYRALGWYYAIPYSYWGYDPVDYNGRFYDDLWTQHLEGNYTLGTIHHITNRQENGVDIDYFAKNYQAIAIQAYLDQSHTPDDLDDILIFNYDVFEYMALRSSNTFKKETAHRPKIFPCGSECSEKGIAMLEFYATIIYEGVADSAELFLDFEYIQGGAIFDMKFHNISRIEYDLYGDSPLAKEVNYLPEDTHEFHEHVKISTDLGTIQRETITYLRIYIEQQTRIGVTENFVVGAYDFYIGFQAEVDEPELKNHVMYIHAAADLSAEYSDSMYSDADDDFESDYVVVDVVERKMGGGDDDDDLSEDEVIAIAVIFSLVGVVTLAILVYCCCCKKDQPAMITERMPGGPPGFAQAPIHSNENSMDLADARQIEVENDEAKQF